MSYLISVTLRFIITFTFFCFHRSIIKVKQISMLSLFGYKNIVTIMKYLVFIALLHYFIFVKCFRNNYFILVILLQNQVWYV